MTFVPGFIAAGSFTRSEPDEYISTLDRIVGTRNDNQGEGGARFLLLRVDMRGLEKISYPVHFNHLAACTPTLSEWACASCGEENSIDISIRGLGGVGFRDPDHERDAARGSTCRGTPRRARRERARSRRDQRGSGSGLESKRWLQARAALCAGDASS